MDIEESGKAVSFTAYLCVSYLSQFIVTHLRFWQVIRPVN